MSWPRKNPIFIGAIAGLWIILVFLAISSWSCNVKEEWVKLARIKNALLTKKKTLMLQNRRTHILQLLWATAAASDKSFFSWLLQFQRHCTVGMSWEFFKEPRLLFFHETWAFFGLIFYYAFFSAIHGETEHIIEMFLDYTSFARAWEWFNFLKTPIKHFLQFAHSIFRSAHCESWLQRDKLTQFSTHMQDIFPLRFWSSPTDVKIAQQSWVSWLVTIAEQLWVSELIDDNIVSHKLVWTASGQWLSTYAHYVVRFEIWYSECL